MPSIPIGARFDERGGRARGVFDLVAGHYPAFLFGGGLRRLLPVFHFHETTEPDLDRAFRYLAENGYRTVVSDEMARLVLRGQHPGPRTVMLAFDDAWSSLWLVVKPLLDRYDFRAVTYAIPGRIRDAAAVRPTLADGPVDAAAADRADHPFVTWPELRALAASGRVDVQSHTWAHAMMFCGAELAGFVDAAYRQEPLLVRPRVNGAGPVVLLDEERAGSPLFPRRSRMSDARRFWPDAEACTRAEAYVEARGGAAFFARPGARAELAAVVGGVDGRWESDEERRREIERELVDARDELESRLNVRVEHLCLPWGVTGTLTRNLLVRLGVVTAFANRLPGRLAVAAGDDPLFLKRLPNRYIFALPGSGRRNFFSLT
jgi:hypothetical protein